MNPPSCDWLPPDMCINGFDRKTTLDLALMVEMGARAGAQAVVAELAERQEEDHETLHGKKTDRSDGVVSRLLRLEITVHSQRKLGWILASAFITALVSLGVVVGFGVGG